MGVVNVDLILYGFGLPALAKLGGPLAVPICRKPNGALTLAMAIMFLSLGAPERPAWSRGSPGSEVLPQRAAAVINGDR